MPAPRNRADEISIREWAAELEAAASIARQLDISVRTAQRRISDIMSALGVDTRFQAGIQATRRGWL